MYILPGKHLQDIRFGFKFRFFWHNLHILFYPFLINLLNDLTIIRYSLGILTENLEPRKLSFFQSSNIMKIEFIELTLHALCSCMMINPGFLFFNKQFPQYLKKPCPSRVDEQGFKKLISSLSDNFFSSFFAPKLLKLCEQKTQVLHKFYIYYFVTAVYAGQYTSKISPPFKYYVDWILHTYT